MGSEPRRYGSSPNTGTLYIAELPERAGRALLTVSSMTSMTGSAASGPGEYSPPHGRRTGNDVRKVIYRDPDGSEIGFGGAPPG